MNRVLYGGLLTLLIFLVPLVGFSQGTDCGDKTFMICSFDPVMTPTDDGPDLHGTVQETEQEPVSTSEVQGEFDSLSCSLPRSQHEVQLDCMIQRSSTYWTIERRRAYLHWHTAMYRPRLYQYHRLT